MEFVALGIVHPNMVGAAVELKLTKDGGTGACQLVDLLVNPGPPLVPGHVSPTPDVDVDVKAVLDRLRFRNPHE